MAMNAYRNFNNNTSALSKNLEKLSSGYRINRAGDDAAGLAISEKMRAQITGLDAAQKNVKDGISLVKTAEGAMQEIQDMMNRMKYLATQSANGTYQNEVDRENLQKEVNALKTEINRIAESSNFNGQKLLNGELAAETTVMETPAGTEIQDMTVSVGTGATGKANAATGNSYKFTQGTNLATGSFHAIEFEYTNEAGETKTLTLASNAVLGSNASTTDCATDWANLLNGSTMTVSNTSSNAKADLEEFMDLFDITASGNDLKISAKEPDSAAKVTSVKVGSAATSGSDASAAATAANKTGSATDAEAANYTMEITATGTATASITIGGKEYVTSDEVNVTGASEKDKAKDLLKQLQADGYDVELCDGTDSSNDDMETIKFKDMSQLQEIQKGVQITNTADDKWDVDADASSKGEMKIELVNASATSTGNSFTINYTDENGEEVSREVKFDVGTAGDKEAGKALLAALKSDAELSKLFDFAADGTDDDILTITSKASGTAAAHITGFSSNYADGVVDSEITAPEDTGKILQMAKKKDGTTDEVIKNGDQITIDGKTYQFMSDMGAEAPAGVTKVALGADNSANLTNLHEALKKDGVKSDLIKDASGNVTGLRFTDGAAKEVETETVTSGGLTLQIGDTADGFNQMKVAISDMHVEALGIADLDVSSLESAQKAIEVITDAINKVSSTRGDLGAIQNRLEHTQNNLSVMEENIQDAESTIRDTDMADEMTTYTKNNILIQAAQAMLAQANQQPQGVLQLLQ